MSTQTTAQSIERNSYLDELGLTISSTFVPFSQSRNKDDKQKSLNWKVTIAKGKQSMTIDYMQGIGHIPGYTYKWGRQTIEAREIQKRYEKTCETGKLYRYLTNIAFDMPLQKALPQPTRDEILYCLVMDSDVLNYGTYAEWASDLGYDEDSRKGEAIYRLCLEQSLKLKNMIGEPAIEQLRELFQDY